MEQALRNTANRYLWFRDNTAVIWFRMAVPKEFRERVGKSLIQEPLSTTDVREARIKAGKRRAELFEEWGVVSAPPKVQSLRDPADIAVTVGFDKMLAAMDERRKDWPSDDTEYDNRLAEREAIRKRWIRQLQDGDLSRWEGVADRAIAKRGLAFEKGSDEYAAFVQALAESNIDAIGVFTRRAEGEFDAEPRSPVVREVKSRAAAKAKPGESIMDLFERMADEALAKDALRPDTVNQNRKVLHLFADFVGSDRAIDSITPQDVYEFREARRAVPPKWNLKREFRGLSLREAAITAAQLDLPKTSFVTVNRELSTISPLFAWIAGEPRWVGLGNPCAGLFYQKVKGKNPRPPFETAALNTLLRSPLFTGFKADGEEHQHGDVHADDWRNWIPLVAMFTGARAGEIAQLRVRDVCKERGVWFVHMKEDAKAGLQVKNRKSRAVPVHSRLAAMGFIAFVERRSEAASGSDDTPLFPELVKNGRDQIGAEPSEWFRHYLAAIGIKDHRVQGGDGFGLHSFRHTLADRLRSEGELLDHEAAIFFGHDQSSTTSGYGRIPQGTVKKLTGWMEAVTWEGVDFSNLVHA